MENNLGKIKSYVESLDLSKIEEENQALLMQNGEVFGGGSINTGCTNTSSCTSSDNRSGCNNDGTC